MDIRARGVRPAGGAMDVSVHFKWYYTNFYLSIFEVSTVMILCNVSYHYYVMAISDICVDYFTRFL